MPTATPQDIRAARYRHAFALVLLVIWTLSGVGVVLGNIPLLNARPVTTPTCSGVAMSPTDTCQQQNYVNGSPTTTQYFTYNQMLASEQPDTGSAPWLIGFGVLMIGSGSLGLYRWFRKRPLLPARFAWLFTPIRLGRRVS
jgi:LPXTG-motif cell wall-anchored protein